jgi:SOS response regulatory protein OraA/RecX
MSSSKTRKQIEDVITALDDAPIDDETANETVRKLGIDVKTLAQELRAKVADADAIDRKKRIDDARTAYAQELERLERRKTEPKRSREDQLGVFRALLAKAPPQGLAMHFHKYESASDEELDELIRALRHLLGENEPE